jgi:hypothetical protein
MLRCATGLFTDIAGSPAHQCFTRRPQRDAEESAPDRWVTSVAWAREVEERSMCSTSDSEKVERIGDFGARGIGSESVEHGADPFAPVRGAIVVRKPGQIVGGP